MHVCYLAQSSPVLSWKFNIHNQPYEEKQIKETNNRQKVVEGKKVSCPPLCLEAEPREAAALHSAHAAFSALPEALRRKVLNVGYVHEHCASIKANT